jgi:hypothetical protein
VQLSQASKECLSVVPNFKCVKRSASPTVARPGQPLVRTWLWARAMLGAAGRYTGPPDGTQHPSGLRGMGPPPPHDAYRGVASWGWCVFVGKRKGRGIRRAKQTAGRLAPCSHMASPPWPSGSQQSFEPWQCACWAEAEAAAWPSGLHTTRPLLWEGRCAACRAVDGEHPVWGMREWRHVYRSRSATCAGCNSGSASFHSRRRKERKRDYPQVRGRRVATWSAGKPACACSQGAAGPVASPACYWSVRWQAQGADARCAGLSGGRCQHRRHRITVSESARGELYRVCWGVDKGDARRGGGCFGAWVWQTSSGWGRRERNERRCASPHAPPPRFVIRCLWLCSGQAVAAWARPSTSSGSSA